MKLLKKGKKAISEATEILKKGKTLVFPTDTAYALGVDATKLKSVQRLYRAKGRSFKKPVHVIVGSKAQARKIAEFDKRAEKIFKKLLPGPITIVLPLKSKKKSFHRLSAESGKIGIRMPKNKVAMRLVKKLGKPITATSANLSGKRTTYSIKDIENQFKNRKLKPDLLLDAGSLKKVKPSTVLDLTGKHAKILRQGPVSLKEINRILSFRA